MIIFYNTKPYPNSLYKLTLLNCHYSVWWNRSFWKGAVMWSHVFRHFIYVQALISLCVVFSTLEEMKKLWIQMLNN